MINYYEYETSPRKEEPEYIPSRRKRTSNTVQNEAELRKKIRKAQVIQARKNVKHIIEVGLVFLVLLAISIEQGMNINNIEQAAKEKLGMQKLENNQKVYITLQKKDYTESSAQNKLTEETTESWWQKLLKTLKGE